MVAGKFLALASACVFGAARAADGVDASNLGVSESLIAELEKELRRDASVLEEWDPLYQLRRLAADGSYSYVDEIDVQFSFAFSYSYSMSFDLEMSYSYSYQTMAPTVSMAPTSFPTFECPAETIFFKTFYGPEDSEATYEGATVDIWYNADFELVRNGQETLLYSITDLSYYVPICLPAGCYKFETTFLEPPSPDMYLRAASPVDTTTNYFTDGTDTRTTHIFEFCLTDLGEMGRAPTAMPSNAPTPSPTARPTPAPTAREEVVVTKLVVGSSNTFPDSTAMQLFYDGFCITEAYATVCESNMRKSYLDDSPFITLSLCDTASTSALPDDDTETTLSIECASAMYTSEVSPRDSTINTAALATTKINDWFSAASAEASWNTDLYAAWAAIDCTTAADTFDTIQSDYPDLYTALGGTRRRLTTFTDLVSSGIAGSTVESVATEDIVWAPTASPTHAPTTTPSQVQPTEVPASAPTPTPSSVPTTSLAPSFAPTPEPTYQVCTVSAECPNNYACCSAASSRRGRSLKFGATYGLCKPSCD